MRRPSAGVIVPCYGYGHLLEGCVRSVLAQEGVDVGVLVIDDCSPDATADVARRLAQADARVGYRRHDVNQGLIPTANEGLGWASGFDYTVLLSADDLLTPGSLRRATAIMEAMPSVGMVYGPAPYAVEGRPLPRPRARWRGTRVWTGHEWLRRRCRSAQNCISSPEVVVRTAVQQAVGGYDPSCHHTSDLNMWLRVAAATDIAYVKGADQAIYRVSPSGMLRSATASDPMVDLRNRRAAFDAFFSNAGSELPDAPELWARACRALARQALWRASRAYDRGLVTGPGALPVDDLVAFARDVCPEVERLREWRGLRVRRRLGAGRSLLFPPFVATGAAHRAHVHVERFRRRAYGV